LTIIVHLWNCLALFKAFIFLLGKVEMFRNAGFFLLSFVCSTLATMKDCSKESSLGKITSLTMDPPAPVSGSWVTIHIDYNLAKTVTGGKATYTASFNGFPLTPTTDDLCADLLNTNTPCPVSAGAVSFLGLSQIGDGTVHGTVTTTTTWTDQDGSEILCWGFNVRI
jgi:hypothetical protein